MNVARCACRKQYSTDNYDAGMCEDCMAAAREKEKAVSGKPMNKSDAKYIMDKFQSDFAPHIEPYNPSDPTLPKLLDAIGWQGGTVADALAEVLRLKMAEERAWIDGYNMAVRYVQLQPELFDESKRPWLNDYLSASKPLGQGVAALLPEHGEVKP